MHPSTFSEDKGSAIFFHILFHLVRPLVRSGTKAVGRETLSTGGKILTDIAARKSIDDVRAGDIVSEHETESVQNLISKLGGHGRKSARAAVGGKKRGPRGPKPQTLKRARKN